MNPDPHVYRIPVKQHGCGRLAMENTIRAFWQSRDPEHRLPDLVDLKKLAKELRGERNLQNPQPASQAQGTR